MGIERHLRQILVDGIDRQRPAGPHGMQQAVGGGFGSFFSGLGVSHGIPGVPGAAEGVRHCLRKVPAQGAVFQRDKDIMVLLLRAQGGVGDLFRCPLVEGTQAEGGIVLRQQLGGVEKVQGGVGGVLGQRTVHADKLRQGRTEIQIRLFVRGRIVRDGKDVQAGADHLADLQAGIEEGLPVGTYAQQQDVQILRGRSALIERVLVQELLDQQPGIGQAGLPVLLLLAAQTIQMLDRLQQILLQEGAALIAVGRTIGQAAPQDLGDVLQQDGIRIDHGVLEYLGILDDLGKVGVIGVLVQAVRDGVGHDNGVEQGRTQRVDVRTIVFAGLRGMVAGGAENGKLCIAGAVVAQGVDVVKGDRGIGAAVAVVRQHEVGGLDVQMQQAGFVQSLDAVGQVDQDGQNGAELLLRALLRILPQFTQVVLEGLAGEAGRPDVDGGLHQRFFGGLGGETEELSQPVGARRLGRGAGGRTAVKHFAFLNVALQDFILGVFLCLPQQPVGVEVAFAHGTEFVHRAAAGDQLAVGHPFQGVVAVFVCGVAGVKLFELAGLDRAVRQSAAGIVADGRTARTDAFEDGVLFRRTAVPLPGEQKGGAVCQVLAFVLGHKNRSFLLLPALPSAPHQGDVAAVVCDPGVLQGTVQLLPVHGLQRLTHGAPV